ncbi:protein trichome birefringence-like 31 [Aristolochia californica]|uniref:protein trichome birefringence-like 31 n=1 Tax=Aristolochia californica TaxID=171875 RepID=UPI0035DBA9CA
MTAAVPSSPHRRIVSFFPFLLVSLLFIGASRLIIENCRSRSLQRCRQFTGSVSDEESRDWRRVSKLLDDGRLIQQCNVFDGEWVQDGESRPLYEEEDCPYLTKQVTCQRNGRPDSLYQNWRWEPHQCKLPRFNALNLLEILRNRRMMFIGDSIQRTQWESMVCLLQSVIPEGKKSIHRDPPRKIFRAEEFNASIEFYWAPFIVESNSDHFKKHTVRKRLVKLDAISKNSHHWEGVDVLVFESYVWWMYRPTINATIGSLGDVKEYDVTTAYQLALETWASWLESKINPHRQKVFFMSSSPTHLWSWEWRAGTEGNCFNESYPIQGPYWGTGSSLDMMQIVNESLEDLKINVTFLNITQLSEFRKDGHTSVYTERRGKLLTVEQMSDPNKYADCIHWCLPGVPDTWNEILYAHLLHELYIQTR